MSISLYTFDHQVIYIYIYVYIYILLYYIYICDHNYITFLWLHISPTRKDIWSQKNSVWVRSIRKAEGNEWAPNSRENPSHLLKTNIFVEIILRTGNHRFSTPMFVSPRVLEWLLVPASHSQCYGETGLWGPAQPFNPGYLGTGHGWESQNWIV